MAFGFPARFSESRKFHLRQDELPAILKSAFAGLGWSYELQPDDEFVAALHNSPMTFGEKFTAKILPEGVIRAESECVSGGLYRMPQIFDFGANKQNVEMFFAQIERTAGKRSSSGNC